jgi:hypothetical protein
VLTGADGCGQVQTGAGRCGQVLVLAALLTGCSGPAAPPPPQANEAPKDAQHAGITEPHGDHTPHHGGVVLMNGDVHYEVVMEPSGKYEVWFTDAVRTELPASIAANTRVEVSRPGTAPEALSLAIDDAGESWVGAGQPVAGDGVMVKLTYDLKGTPNEVEIPFVAAKR